MFKEKKRTKCGRIIVSLATKKPQIPIVINPRSSVGSASRGCARRANSFRAINAFKEKKKNKNQSNQQSTKETK
jgi:hypothetical protein